ncbi:MAG: DoxX family protein [Veillonella sp.]|uniref:DoxX family protein n=1 Tax=Veillonella sp. TaxID=1926307 RepID=UPI0025EBAA06|nr:DoxX family protein [Veillonella sp.]MBS4913845.1 DoxX family protein [Veillonella sp.]
MNALFKFNWQDHGLLFYRVLLGLSMMFHGYLKFAGGEQMLYGVGSMLGQFGITGGYLVLGTLAAFSELVGGLLLVLGLFTRLGALMVAGTLFVATMVDLGGGFFKWDYPSQMMFGAIMLLIAGPGRFSFDNRWAKKN